MTPAKLYTLRLYRRGGYKHEIDMHLDPADDSRLRQLLEQRVEVETGTLRLDLADGWELRVMAVGGGRLYARASVDGSGRTVVRR